MPKYTVTVTEKVTMAYDTVDIDALDRGDAEAQAEDMRVSGALGEARFVSVDDVRFSFIARKRAS